MDRFMTFATLLTVLLGILFCYLAFEVVRRVAWTLLIHWAAIGALLAAGVAVYLWRSLRRN